MTAENLNAKLKGLPLAVTRDRPFNFGPGGWSFRVGTDERGVKRGGSFSVRGEDFFGRGKRLPAEPKIAANG